MDGDNVISLPQLVSLEDVVKENEVYKDDESTGQMTTKPIVNIRNNDAY